MEPIDDTWRYCSQFHGYLANLNWCPQAVPCKAQSQDDWAVAGLWNARRPCHQQYIRRQRPARPSHKMTGPCRALPEGLVTNNIRRQCPARSSHKMTGPCRALPEGLVTNNNIRRQCPARPGDYKMTWALSGFAGVLLPTIISAGNALQGLVTKMTWTLPGFAAIAYFHPQYHPQATPCKALSLRWHGPARVLQNMLQRCAQQYSSIKCCQDLPRFAQIYHDLPRFTTICRFQPCGFKAFPDPNSSTSAMECRDFLAANFNGDQLRTFFLQLMMHLATFKRMAWRTEFYNQWKDLHSGTGIS